MIDLDKINIAEHEFTGVELGELLLESVKQMKQGQFTRTHNMVNAEQARAKTGLSQKDFAQLLGVSVRTLQAWEQGRRTPSKGALTLLKIADKHPQILLSI